ALCHGLSGWHGSRSDFCSTFLPENPKLAFKFAHYAANYRNVMMLKLWREIIGELGMTLNQQ
ncbi:MAG: hypothetical protein K2J64_00305, partial [Desulfovibrio sp.]|nr:hypothetical protein [Desulfovibrio sp.]